MGCPEAIVELKQITKTFPSVIANDKVDLTLYPGEVHALLGENGAGKSTIMSILTGTYKPDEGDFFYKGEKRALKSPKDALNLGIGMVHQHFRLAEPLTIAENIMLTEKKGSFLLDIRATNEKISKLSTLYGLEADLSAKVWQLSIGEQQRVEILKLLYQGMEVLILDEPTAVLTPQEAKSLFTNLHKMAEMGKAVVFITHKLNEVMNYADRITVMRGGKSVAAMKRGETSKQELTRLMVGRELIHNSNTSVNEITGGVVLTLSNVCANNDKNLLALDNVSLSVRAGEILCIAGVAGNGQRELGEAIAGLRKITKGSISLNDQDITNKSPKHIIKNGLSFIPEDRLGMGLIPNFNMIKNTILKNFDESISSKNSIIKEKEIKERTLKITEESNIQTSGITYPVRLMSGGNQQKLLFAREIECGPIVIVAAYPARGLDIGATEAIHKILLDERASGVATLVISEDLDEIFSLADTIAVLFEGKIMGVLPKSEATYERVGRLMLGEAENEGVPGENE